MKKTRKNVALLPSHIMTAVNALLQPFELSLEYLMQQTCCAEIDEKEETWLTIEECEKRYKVSRWTIRRWAIDKKVQTVKLNRARCSKVLINKSTVDAMLRQCEFSNREE